MTHKETLTLLGQYGWSDKLQHDFQPYAAQGLVPSHPTLGDVDSPEALERYQAAKRAHKAKMRAQAT